MGIDSRRADEMEIYEIGCAFGLNHPPAADTEETGPAEPAAGWDPIKARVEARRAGLPEPTAPPTELHRRRPIAG